MSQTKPKPIEARGGYTKKSPAENLAFANAVHSGMFTDPVDFPAPPVDEATFKGAIDTLSTKITAALDGGKKAIAERNHQEQVVTKMRPATTIAGFTPGTTYAIQVRSFADATGFTDWSDPVTRIAT